jgi:hypothetical protein
LIVLELAWVGVAQAMPAGPQESEEIQ